MTRHFTTASLELVPQRPLLSSRTPLSAGEGGGAACGGRGWVGGGERGLRTRSLPSVVELTERLWAKDFFLGNATLNVSILTLVTPYLYWSGTALGGMSEKVRARARRTAARVLRCARLVAIEAARCAGAEWN